MKPASPTKPTSNKQRAWQRMLSGRRLDLLDPNPADIEIEDIAHGLARVARWNGQTLGAHALSVAQHSVIVEEIGTAIYADWSGRDQLAALLHDAAEYVVGDLISPFKSALGLDYKAFELRLMEAVHSRFGLPPQNNAELSITIKGADQIAAYYEATVLAGFSHDEAELYFGHARNIPQSLAAKLGTLTPHATNIAQQVFLERFQELQSTDR